MSNPWEVRPRLANLRLPLGSLSTGVVYRLVSNNLRLGVWAEAPKDRRLHSSHYFIGIRTKFAKRFLDTEYDYETGSPYGTAVPMRVVVTVPANILLATSIGYVDGFSGRSLTFHTTGPEPWVGHWCFAGTDVRADGARPNSIPNKDLFDFLDHYEHDEHQRDPLDASMWIGVEKTGK